MSQTIITEEFVEQKKLLKVMGFFGPPIIQLFDIEILRSNLAEIIRRRDENKKIECGSI